MKVIVNAYYDLHMVDLAQSAEKVYADNFPGSDRDLLPKKHWYQNIL
jgi:outer membrane protein assembly factor BamD (BamD/ComL family)